MKKIIKLLPLKSAAILLTAIVVVLTACDNPVYDDEGNCEVTYNLRFVYDMNLKWADAFPSEVNTVHLYAFDRNTGLFVKEFAASGAALKNKDYTMRLDLVPGKYTLVAWCENQNEDRDSYFTVPQPVAGKTRIEELTCTLNTTVESRAENYSDNHLNFLYHGKQDVDLPKVYNGKYDYTIYLTKDTHHFRIMLHQMSAEKLEAEDFEFTIEEADRVLGYDNTILDSDIVCYRPWNVDMEQATSDEQKTTYGIFADLSTSRLNAARKDKVYLTISGKGKVLFRVPILEYALMGLDYYRMAYDHPEMDEQEFLDRQDECFYTFILDESQKWISVEIKIAEWRVVKHNYELGN